MLPSILSWWNCIFSRGWTCWRFISSRLCCCLLRSIVRGLQLMECHGDRVLALANRKQDTCWSGMRWVWLAMFFCLQQENHSAAFLLDLFELFLEVYRDLQSSDFPRVHSSLPCSWGTSPPSWSCCFSWQWRYPNKQDLNSSAPPITLPIQTLTFYSQPPSPAAVLPQGQAQIFLAPMLMFLKCLSADSKPDS